MAVAISSRRLVGQMKRGQASMCQSLYRMSGTGKQQHREGVKFTNWTGLEVCHSCAERADREALVCWAWGHG